MTHQECKLQQACVRYLTYRYSHLAWNHSPNEAKRTTFQGQILKDMGMTKGWPDLEIVHDGAVLFIEFKSATGRQSKEQKYVQEILERQGCAYALCRTLEEFVELCHRYLGQERDPDKEALMRILRETK